MGSLAEQVAELEARCKKAEHKLGEVRATLKVNYLRGLQGKDGQWVISELLKVLFPEDFKALQPNETM